MDTLYIPNQDDFRRWIKEAVQESLEKSASKKLPAPSPEEEPLLSRKEVAAIFRISLVTLHDWMNRGLPCHKQRGRVYFIRSEVIDYVKRNHRKSFQKAETPIKDQN